MRSHRGDCRTWSPSTNRASPAWTLVGLAAAASAGSVVASVAGCGGRIAPSAQEAPDAGADASVADAAPDAPLPSEHACARAFGDGSQMTTAIAVAPTHDIAVAGTFRGSIDLGAGPLATVGDTDVFVAAYAPDCTLRWARRYGSLLASAHSVAFTADGGVIVAGDFSGSIALAGKTATAAANHRRAFVVKIDGDGREAWGLAFGDEVPETFASARVEASGNILLSGYFSGSFALGATTLTSAGNEDVFVARLDGAGSVVSAQRFGDAKSQSGGMVPVGAGELVAYGSTRGAIDFGGCPMALSPGTVGALYVARIDARGRCTAGATFASESDWSIAPVAVDPRGHVWLTGSFTINAVFGALALHSRGQDDGFVVELDPTLVPLHAWRFGADGIDRGTSIAVDPNGVTVGGFFEGTLDLITPAAAGFGAKDLLVAHIPGDGGAASARTFGSPAADAVLTLTADGDQPVFGGYVGGAIDLDAGAPLPAFDAGFGASGFMAKLTR